MKIKAIAFKADGNSIKDANFDVTEIAPGIYHTQPDSENYNSVFVILEKNGAAFVDGQTNIETLIDNLEHAKQTLADLENYIYEKIKWPNLVHLEFAKRTGMDVDRILKRREAIKAEREAKNHARETEREAEQNRIKNEHAEKMWIVKEKLKRGDNITFDDLIKCMDHFGYDIHPRTKGTINKQPSHFEVSNNSGRFVGKIRQSTVNNIFDAIKDFANS